MALMEFEDLPFFFVVIPPAAWGGPCNTIIWDCEFAWNFADAGSI
jgi:hypothetical protein